MSGIVENAVGGLIASEAHGVIGMVLSRVKEEIKLAWGFEKELEELQRQLTRLSGLLQGASGSGQSVVTNPLMADWLEKIKDAAYDADDLLDEWSYAALEARIQTRKRDKFKRGVSKPFHSLNMGHKARELTNLISDIYCDANKLGIKPIHVAGGEVYNTHHRIEDRETRLCNQRHFVDEKLVIGRDEDLTHLVKLLCHPNNVNSSHLNVIGIVGMAGLGKTTLCKRISKVQEVIKFFDTLVIWLVITRNFDLLDVLNRMVEILFKVSSSMRDKQALVSKLREKKLKEKRYLLILDDVWDTIQWEPLKSTLEEIGGSFGTTILVTSRDKYVIRKMVTSCRDAKDTNTLKRPHIYTLRGLSEDDSWSLFMARISDDNLVGNEKELMARRMMKNCGGVPLAIRALGDLLRDKSIGWWKEIEKSHLWTKVDKNDILPSLRLSYDYLPYKLKKCFAYCDIFEEDEVIKKQKLICMWMAQGFLHPYEVMENKGKEYIDHLLNSSLFQEAEMDEYGEVVTFKMHDLVWSLAQAVSMGESLSLNKDEKSNKVRHLLVPEHSNSQEVSLTSFTKLRTCLIYKMFKHPSLHYLLECRHLRVLHIGVNWSENLDWEPLGNLIHLRYFEISVENCLGIMQSNLAKHISKLYHLQTLCIKNKGIYNDRIRYPREIGKLVNLRHILDDCYIGVPEGLFHHLTALQTLPTIDLEMKWGGRLSEIGLLTNLRGTLKIRNLYLLNDVEKACDLTLSNKSYLECLDLNWGYFGSENPHASEILEALQPNVNLKMLEIWYYNGASFSRWLMIEGGSSLPNLVSLKIHYCPKVEGNLKLENFRSLCFLEVISCYKMNITLPKEGFQCCKSLEKLFVFGCNKVINPIELGNLPCLRELCTDELELVAYLGEDMPVCKSLEKLRLDGRSQYDDITTLPDQLQHLQSLQRLTITYFKSLETIPDWLGKLTSLKRLSLHCLPNLKNLPCQNVMQQFYTHTGEDLCPLLKEDIHKFNIAYYQ